MIEYISALVGLEVNLSESLDGIAPQSWPGQEIGSSITGDKQDPTKILRDCNFKCCS